MVDYVNGTLEIVRSYYINANSMIRSMEVLYPIRLYCMEIFPYIALKNRPCSTYGRFLQSISSCCMAIDGSLSRLSTINTHIVVSHIP